MGASKDVRRVEMPKFGNHIVKLDEELTILFGRSTAVKRPAFQGEFLVKGTKEGLLNVVREGHIIFDGV